MWKEDVWEDEEWSDEEIRSFVRPYIWFKIGNGKKGFGLVYKWNENCPLISHMSYKAINNAGFNLHDIVSDVVANGSWLWPAAWHDTFPILINVPTLSLNDEQPDMLHWRMRDGSFKLFSVRDVWHSIRDQGNKVEWYHLVWSRFCIPRHANNLWLVMRRRLKTHDRMRQWDVGNDVDLNLLRCPLCKTEPDSHNHLNNRVHGKCERNPEQLTKVIGDMVRLKLAFIPFKNKARVDNMRKTWRIASIQIEDG
ncbi:reverse transcriptase domain, reverse transcriptase zinc-binding domain protein [Tanacetum coccineum]